MGGWERGERARGRMGECRIDGRGMVGVLPRVRASNGRMRPYGVRNRIDQPLSGSSAGILISPRRRPADRAWRK